MSKKIAGDVAELLNRAEADVKPGKRSPAAPQRIEPERRYVYGGDPQSQTPGYAARPSNKKVAQKKRRSTFNIISVLFLLAVGIILYIGNLLTVNELAVEVHQLQVQHDKTVNANSVLKAEINRKSAWERIGNTAKQQVGLTYPKERPRSFDVDGGKLEKFKGK